MIERPDPDALMAGPLGTWLTSTNEERAQVKARASKIAMAGIGGAVLVAFAITLLSGNIGAALKVGFVIGLGGFGLSEWTKRPMLKRLKGGINDAIAKALGLNFSVEVEASDSFEWAKQFDLLPGHDDSRFEDHWWGDLGPRPFSIYEAKLTEERGSGNNRRTETVFEGSIMQIDFARRFNGTTVIEADGRRRKFFVGAEKDRATIGGIEMQRINLTNREFEDRFTVWSSDPVEGQYLVHPSYVERLLAVERAFAGKNVHALFHQGSLVITLETGDLFESGSLDAGSDRDLLARTIEQFGSLADLAAQLNERERMTFADLGQPSLAGRGSPYSRSA